MTVVHCLDEPSLTFVYSLPPRLAVFAAHQYAKGQRNTYLYDREIEKNPPKRTYHGWVCGSYLAYEEIR